MPGVDASISFEDQDTLTLAPGEIATVTIVTSPPDHYAIDFHLVGDALDASLDADQVITDDAGVARVKLRAPNGATNFGLKATIADGPSVTLAVSVSEKGFGSLNIEPVYDGERDADLWVAQVVSGTTCEALTESFPDDPAGALDAKAVPGESLTVESAPVGPNLAVFVRAGHYMWGCSDETDLVAGESADVKVVVVNKPIDTSAAALAVALDYQPEEAPYQAILDNTEATMKTAFFGASASNEAMLLDEMELLSADPSGFAQARSDNDWTTAVNSHLSTHQVDLDAALSGWVSSGLASQPPTIRGRIDSFEQIEGFTLFTLEQIGSVSPAAAGVPNEYLMELTVDPDDTVRLGGDLFWIPSAYVAAVVESEALAQNTSAASFADVLAATAHCDSLDLQGMVGCDAGCITQLCQDALVSRWATARDATASQYQWGEIAVQASGSADFDDVASLTGFGGMWLGEVRSGAIVAKVTGTAAATPPAGPATP
jgi:hypothetical protein